MFIGVDKRIISNWILQSVYIYIYIYIYDGVDWVFFAHDRIHEIIWYDTTRHDI